MSAGEQGLRIDLGQYFWLVAFPIVDVCGVKSPDQEAGKGKRAEDVRMGGRVFRVVE